MDDQANDNAGVSKHGAEWHQEAVYHLERAAQEQRLAALSKGLEAEIAHSTLALRHLARASAAEAAAHMTDVDPVHGS